MLPDDTEVDDTDDTDQVADEADEGSDVLDSDEDGDEHGPEVLDDEGAADGEKDDAERGDDGEGKRPAQVKGRAKNDFGKLRERARAAEERAERAERDAAEARRLATERSGEEGRRAEQERLALMGPDEKLEYYRQQDRLENDRRFQRLEFQNADARDAASFEAKCARNPALAAVADEVERVLAEERRQGRAGATRETIAAYVIGKKALANAGRAKGKQAKRAVENRERQTARSGTSRSNVASGSDRRGSEAEQRRKRLENMEI